MKITKIKDPEALLKVIDSCTGKVELVTAEGDRLNLKSKLCQLISLTSIFSINPTSIPELELIAYEAEDSKKLIEFLIYQ